MEPHSPCIQVFECRLLLLQLGEDHDRTNESSECLKHLTQQAVKFQKTMNQLSKGEKVNMMSPIQVSAIFLKVYRVH